MEEDNKPEATDASEVEESTVETQGADESLEDLFEEEAGNEDVVSDAPDADAVFKAEMERISGRSFKSAEDARKHYKNLTSFVGKKAEPEKKDATSDPVAASMERIQAIEARLEEKELLSENPDAKEHLKIIRAVAKDKGVSLMEAFDEVKDVIESASKYKKEREIGVSSKNRINPQQEKKLQQLAKRAAESGRTDDQEAFVAARLGL